MAQPWAGWRPSLRLVWSPAATPRPAPPQLEQPLVRTAGQQRDHSHAGGLLWCWWASSTSPRRPSAVSSSPLELTPQRFVDEIAPARTFGFREQVEQLVLRG